MMVEDIPGTVSAETQSGGTHILYRLPGGVTVPNSRSKLGRGIDIKSAGGYIVAPGSDIDGRPYRWFPGFGPDQIEVAPAPQWLLDQARAPIKRTAAAGKRRGGRRTSKPSQPLASICGNASRTRRKANETTQRSPSRRSFV